MKFKHNPFIFVLILSLGIVACGTSGREDVSFPLTEAPSTATIAPPTATTLSPTETVSPPTATSPPTNTLPPSTNTPPPTPTTAPTECEVGQIIENLYTDLSREQFVFIANGVFVAGKGPVLTLSFWFIDYLINPQPGDNADDALNHAGTALESALNATKHIENFDPCIDEVFVSINPIVVDRAHNGWISFEVTTGVLPEKIDLTDGSFKSIMDQHVKLGYVRTAPPAPLGPPPAGACTWETVHQSLDQLFASSSNGNTGFFFVRDDHGSNVWVYLDSNNVTMSTDYLGDDVELILDEIECLYPSPDNLIVRTVGDGVVLFSQRLPREGIQKKDLSQFVPFP